MSKMSPRTWPSPRRFEYNNTIRDLLGDTTHPADDFPSEEKRLGFDNNAAVLQISQSSQSSTCSRPRSWPPQR